MTRRVAGSSLPEHRDGGEKPESDIRLAASMTRRLTMTVATILNEKGRQVLTVGQEETIESTAKLLADKQVGAIVIADSDRHVIGIISERDVVRAIARGGKAALEQKVEAFMTHDVVTCHEDDTIVMLMERMTDGKFRHLPVVQDGILSGIVSIGDVVKQRIAEAEFEARAMREYIATG
ncbi:MAG: CBS domain-containing protein [Fimbriimonadaceae bacterium]|nr:CBS domain-containing protein [Alphaproteobacteria bacterium]